MTLQIQITMNSHGVEKGLDKLLFVKEENPEKVSTFIHVQPPITANPRTQVRAKYLQARLTALPNKAIQVVIASATEVEHDKTDHAKLNRCREECEDCEIGLLYDYR